MDNLSLHRHRLRLNFLFFDSHVELLTYAEASGNQGENWGTDQHKKPAEEMFFDEPTVIELHGGDATASPPEAP